jgi:hypothetical protein
VRDAPPPRLTALRLGLRAVLWLHALLWAVFALGMVALALTDPGSAENPVFLQVTAASCVVAIGSLGAALLRQWGAALALAGGAAFMLAWIAGNSGHGYRLPVAALLGLFALAAMAERRTRISGLLR